MTERRLTTALTIAIALVAGTWGIQRASAQSPAAAAAPAMPAGFKRTELARHDISQANHEAITARGEFQPGAAVPKHSHPGEEVGYVLEGELTVEIAGKPAQAVKAGETFFIPAGTVHSGKNTGKGQTTVISTYIVEKGKPLSTMAK